MSSNAEVRLVPVRDVGEVRIGKQLSPSNRDSGTMFPYLRVANVFEDRIDFSDVKMMGFSSSELGLFGLLPGDILLNEGQENLYMVGRSAIYSGGPGSYCFQNTLIRFRPGPELIPEYAQIVFVNWRRHGVFARVAEKTSISHLGGSRFASLMFPLPSLERQREILEVVDALARQERSIKASIAKLVEIRSAVMNAALSEMSWNASLSDVIDGRIRNGFSPVEASGWTGVKVLGLGCLTPGGFNPVQLKNAPSSVAVTHSAILRDGDLLMSRSNTRELVGLVGVYRDVGVPCIYPDLMMRIPLVDNYLVEFAAAVLMSFRVRRQVRSMSQGTSESMAKISAATVQRISIPVPALKVQMRILNLWRSFSDPISQENEELSKLRKLKQGIVDDLLSGRVSA